jgi:hypothetical protein
MSSPIDRKNAPGPNAEPQLRMRRLGAQLVSAALGDNLYALYLSPLSSETAPARRMTEDPAARADLSGKAALRAREFTWGRCADQTLKVYRCVAITGVSA